MEKFSFFSNSVPSKRFEELRRKVYTDVKDVAFYLNAKLENFDKLNIAAVKKEFNNRIKLVLNFHF